MLDHLQRRNQGIFLRKTCSRCCYSSQLDIFLHMLSWFDQQRSQLGKLKHIFGIIYHQNNCLSIFISIWIKRSLQNSQEDSCQHTNLKYLLQRICLDKLTNTVKWLDQHKMKQDSDLRKDVCLQYQNIMNGISFCNPSQLYLHRSLRGIIKHNILCSPCSNYQGKLFNTYNLTDLQNNH